MAHKHRQRLMISLIVYFTTCCQAAGKPGMFTGSEGTENKIAAEKAIADALSEYAHIHTRSRRERTLEGT
jgi:hypothetical protein